ncbi:MULTISPECIES: hypothetical protein [Paenarthrobacter]|uniref:Uncharacterized protein n=1 Tax=Paenarthrobacter ureafaciens TaxID=37931 RepID=A0AAX3EDN4_PAEUR|nr:MULTISPECIES: hypothetical protein [Paenarthrobacter]NKR13302.1 hypothetical protein [Arthrobacter sp. M5]NKR14848.1 hypothetical protein [Arthrobacter sp. M6]OEH62400.1 hypothetical protein A5N13_01715 [Arthrobacter sp. D4]OEH62971.1 hypothetical protein A5N17_09955 [Arthrobacter sp. D2]MDO5865147.1 hypothetical protein [Paenarthrobacter sp. SD-2]
MPEKPERSFEQALAEDLGIDFDVELVELQLGFVLDYQRIRHGEQHRMGYVLLDREHHPDAAIVFATPDAARRALDGHPLIENLCEEDCIDARLPVQLTLSDLASREIILP